VSIQVPTFQGNLLPRVQVALLGTLPGVLLLLLAGVPFRHSPSSRILFISLHIKEYFGPFSGFIRSPGLYTLFPISVFCFFHMTYSFVLKMEAAISSKTLYFICQVLWHHVTEYSNLCKTSVI
jgi:hypothetical protein